MQYTYTCKIRVTFVKTVNNRFLKTGENEKLSARVPECQKIKYGGLDQQYGPEHLGTHLATIRKKCGNERLISENTAWNYCSAYCPVAPTSWGPRGSSPPPEYLSHGLMQYISPLNSSHIWSVTSEENHKICCHQMSGLRRLKCTKFDFSWGFAPDLTGELTALTQIP